MKTFYFAIKISKSIDYKVLLGPIVEIHRFWLHEKPQFGTTRTKINLKAKTISIGMRQSPLPCANKANNVLMRD